MNLKILDGKVTSEIIKDLIEGHSATKAKMIKLYNSYKGEVPIKKREFEDQTKINNKLANDYRGEIIDEITGYMYGKPISYSIDNQKHQESKFNALNKILQDFISRNSIEDLDSETGKKSGICGYGARLCYIDREGNERLMDVDPWECIFISDGSIDEPQYALRYYPFTIGDKETTKVEWYDNESVTFYIEANGQYIPDTKTEDINPRSHLFDYIPLIKFSNNSEEMGDFEKVESLIDAYDRIISDSQNEVEEQRLAYMLFYGVEIDAETMELARRTGAFGGLDAGEGNRVEFLTKEINDTFHENHKKTLNDNIYKFSKTVDMNDEKFSGSAMTGEARKWKLLALENRAITKERKFLSALKQQFKVICSAWNKKGIQIDYLDLFFTMTRNIPIDLLYVADSQMKLKGLISERTRLAENPLVDDIEYEMQAMEEESAITLDDIEDDDNAIE